MLRTGLVSATFRGLEPAAIIELAAQAGCDGIEWSGDVHVPAGELELARTVGEATRAAGLSVIAYDSYYRATPEETFQPVLDTALTLGAPLIRVWAGRKSSADMPPRERLDVAARLAVAARTAARSGLRVATEYHKWSLTDELETALQLLREVGPSPLETLWQGFRFGDVRDAEAELEALEPWLANLHVFFWGPGGFKDRRPLREGAAFWQPLLARYAKDDVERHASLEFVAGDAPEQFRDDVACLQGWIRALQD
ncbi:MAG: Xylose isomerase domain-containing protein [Puniceicoccaceae bacterium 5H]|nr:MAG: Xylose isomerase domain-containing protein [Puniceicoccaceae bacterium 5H]